MEGERDYPAEPYPAPTPTNPWVAVGLWSLILAGLGGGLNWLLPSIIEGYWQHAPATATITGRTSHTHRKALTKSHFYQITWTDDRGQRHLDELEVGGAAPSPNRTLEIRYALNADGSTKFVWETDIHPAFWIMGLLGSVAVLAVIALWFQSLWSVIKAPPGPAPTPDSDLSP